MTKTEEMFNKLGMRLGAEISIPLKEGYNEAPAGCIVEKFDMEHKVMICKPVQKEVNGQWVAIKI